ncbi:PREDICTED: zinc finger protein 136-like, partial [Galeopterus variegatus]|uniref:Zinc finger protein 136-like n=1 Tax=Galeopterus variegatus TaxID=482537 RepID=A0ABM0RZL4_GALVR
MTVHTYVWESFDAASTFQVHERTHTGEKHYECKKCGEAFSSHLSTEKHMTIHESAHTGEKPCESKKGGKALSLSSSIQ